MSETGTKTLLRNMRLKRVSLVGNPANEEALVTLFKSADHKEEPVNKDDDVGSCAKCKSSMGKGATVCPSCGAKVTKGADMDLEKLDPEVKKHLEKIATDLATVTAEKTALATKVADLEKAAKPAPKEEDVLKGLSPEARALVEKAQASAADSAAKVALLSDAIEKANDSAIEKAFVEECETFKNISGDAKVLGGLFKRVHQGKTTKEDVEVLRTAFKAASAAAKPLLRIVGKGETPDGSGASVQTQIDAAVKAIIAKDATGKVDYATALDVVMKENPGLWRRYQSEALTHTVAAGEEE